MTLRKLLLALSTFVAETVRDYPFPSPDGQQLDCRVFLHGLPENQDDGTYPFVLVRWQEGDIESMEDSKTVLRDSVALVLGVHSPKDQAQAGLLCAELMDVLRRAIWKQRILASCFQLVEPLRSMMPDADRQQHRFHLATIDTVWDYTWPPKALEEAGQSQLRTAEALGAQRPYGSGVLLAGTGSMSMDSYSESELALAKGQSKIWS